MFILRLRDFDPLGDLPYLDILDNVNGGSNFLALYVETL